MKTVEMLEGDIAVRPQTFCTRCGKERNVILHHMKHGFSWYCLWCYLRYRLAIHVNRILGRVVM